MSIFDKFKKYKSEESTDMQNFLDEQNTSFRQMQSEPVPNQWQQSPPLQPMMQQPPAMPEPNQPQWGAFVQNPTSIPQNPHYDYSRNIYAEWENYIQSIAEKVVEDKLKEIDNKIMEIKFWKEKMEMNINKLSEKIDQIEKRLNDINNLVIKKVEDYDKGIREATTEVQALHRLIRTMVPAISESVKELRETINEIKQLRDSIRTP